MGDSGGLGPTGGKVDLSNAGTVVGKIKLTGEAPEMGRLDISKDPWCGKNHEVFDEKIVSEGGGLGDVGGRRSGFEILR